MTPVGRLASSSSTITRAVACECFIRYAAAARWSFGSHRRQRRPHDVRGERAFFAGRPIPAADLDQNLEAGRSPSSQNWQPWDIVLVTDRSQLRELAKVWRGTGHVTAISLGYPADRPLAPIRNLDRRPFREVVHRGGRVER
jgi:nitroreductase